VKRIRAGEILTSEYRVRQGRTQRTRSPPEGNIAPMLWSREDLYENVMQIGQQRKSDEKYK